MISLKWKSHCIHLQPPCIYQWSLTLLWIKVTVLCPDREGLSYRRQLHSPSALAIENYLALLESSYSAKKPDSFCHFFPQGFPWLSKGTALLWEEHLEKAAPLRRYNLAVLKSWQADDASQQREILPVLLRVQPMSRLGEQREGCLSVPTHLLG